MNKKYEEKGLVFLCIAIIGLISFILMLIYLIALQQHNMLTWYDFLNSSCMGIIGIVGSFAMFFGLSVYIYILDNLSIEKSILIDTYNRSDNPNAKLPDAVLTKFRWSIGDKIEMTIEENAILFTRNDGSKLKLTISGC